MTQVNFKATIKIIGINPYVYVSQEQTQMLKSGWKKPIPVIVQLNGDKNKLWQTNLIPVGDGRFYLYLHTGMRKLTETKVGDLINIMLVFNNGYHNGPMHPMPEWFENALNKNMAALKSWEKLTPSRKKEILRYFDSLKSTEAKQRNIQRALEALSGEPVRFMGRSWSDGA